MITSYLIYNLLVPLRVDYAKVGVMSGDSDVTIAFSIKNNLETQKERSQ